MSLRVIGGGEQFADGTGISGARLERAMDRFVERFNDLPVRDVARRFVQCQMVLGFQPSPVASAITLPFLNTLNAAAEVADVTPDGFENARRMKSVFVHTDVDVQYAWTAALYFKRPVILRQVDFALIVDSTYINSFAYGAVPPPNRANGDPVDDFHVVVTVDSPFAAEDQGRNTLLLRRGDFRAASERFTTQAPPGTATFRPDHPTNEATGVLVHLRDLYAPVPRDARVRLSLVLPHWAGDLSPWISQPWRLQVYSGCLTFLEQIG